MATPVYEHWRTGARAPWESCWVTLTPWHIHMSTIDGTWRESQWALTHFILWHCHGIDASEHCFCWWSIEVKTENTDLPLSFLRWNWCSNVKSNTCIANDETTGCFRHQHIVCFHVVSVHEGWFSAVLTMKCCYPRRLAPEIPAKLITIILLPLRCYTAPADTCRWQPASHCANGQVL